MTAPHPLPPNGQMVPGTICPLLRTGDVMDINEPLESDRRECT